MATDVVESGDWASATVVEVQRFLESDSLD